ncbi:MAG: hypothetical protein ACP6IS_04430 [Candidatus Asgardarchaeia archaeon]
MREGVYALRFIGIIYATFIVYFTYFSVVSRDIWNFNYLTETVKILWSVISIFLLSTLAFALTTLIILILFQLLNLPPSFIFYLVDAATKYLSSEWHFSNKLILPEFPQIQTPFQIFEALVEFLMPFIVTGLIIVAFITAVSYISYIFSQSSKASISITITSMITIVVCYYMGKVNTALLALNRSTDFLTFVQQPGMLYLLLIFGFPIFSFYLDHLRWIFDPAVQRSKMVEKQLSIIKKFATTETLIKGEIPLSIYTRAKYGPSAFNFIREVIEKRIFRKKGLKEELISIHEIRKLNAYINQIKEKTPDKILSLKGSFAVPSFLAVTVSIVSSIIVQIILFLVFSYLIINPELVYSYIGASPQILESIDILVPEFSLMILLPLATTIPFVSMIITFMKKRKLKKIREIILKSIEKRT